MLLVIRHTHAGDRGAWDGDDRLRPVSERGRRQAEQLVDTLAGYPVTRILTSPYTRCVQTVEPLADTRGIEIETRDDLAETTPREVVRRLLGAVGDTDVVLCSHGDVIGDLVGELRLLGIDLPDAPGWPKGSTWVLETAGGQFTSARYLPPPDGRGERGHR